MKTAALLLCLFLLSACSIESHYYSDGLTTQELTLNDDLADKLDETVSGRTIEQVATSDGRSLTLVLDDGTMLRIRRANNNELLQVKYQTNPSQPDSTSSAAAPVPTPASRPRQNPAEDFRQPQPTSGDPWRNLTTEEVEQSHDFGDDDWMIGIGG